MKNIFKIIFILCLGIFVVTGCADNSSSGNGGNTGNGGDNNGDGDNTGEVYTPEFTKLISLGGLSYGETADGKRYVWGNAGELAGAGNKDEVTTPVEVDLTITDNITKINDDSLNGATYYIVTDKGLYIWGNNYYGQAGNGESGYEKDEDGNDDIYNPKQVLTPYKAVDGNIKEFKISGSYSSATYYALTDTGLYVWGYNRYGQVGNGTTDDVLTPYKVVEGNIKEFKNSSSTYYVLTDTGLYAWGDNGNGEVGNGDGGYEKGEDGNDDYSKPKQVLTPYKVEGITGNIKEVIPGNTVYALTEDGLYVWGYNRYGQVGNGESGYEKDENGNNNYSKPKLVLTPHKVQGIDGSIKKIIPGNTVYALTENGLYAWGNNSSGQVGNMSLTSSGVLFPYKVEGITGNIKEVITDENTVYVLTDTGLYAWGYNGNGEVGYGTTIIIVTFPYRAVEGNIKEFRVSGSGTSATYYVLTDTGLYVWGYNEYGQVGNGESGYEKDENGNNNYLEPKLVLTPYKAVNGNIKDLIISGSSYYATYYVLTDSGLYAWGYNRYGQVGSGTIYDVLTPYKVVEGNIKEFKNSSSTYYVLTDTGLYAWGYNENGKVGNGTTDYRVFTPYKVEGITGNIKEVITGDTVYVLTDTGLYVWGYNEYGQVGNGTTDYRVLTPYKEEGITGNIKEVIPGSTVYVLTDTGLYAWGYNGNGEVGNGTTDYRVLTPYKVQVKKQN